MRYECQYCYMILENYEVVRYDDGFGHAFGYESYIREECPHCGNTYLIETSKEVGDDEKD